MYIYKITNINNNKIYIGLTIQKINDRFSHHIYEAKRGSASYFHRAIMKHSPKSFIVEQIDTANTIDELREKEIFYIFKYNTTNRKIGYNLSPGGEGTPGVLKSKETREKIRQKALGRVISKETKDKISKSNLGKKVNEKTYNAMQTYNKLTSKIVLELDIDNNIVNKYSNIGECAKALKLDRFGVSVFLNKRNNKLYNKKHKLVFQD